MEIRSGLYLLCAVERYPNGKRPRHYIGAAVDIADRIYKHRTAPDVRLLQVMRDAGIDWECVRVWIGPELCNTSARYHAERRLKTGGHYDRLCPHCNPDGYSRHAAMPNEYESAEIEIPF